MIASIFKNNSCVLGVDYSSLDDCVWVIEVNEEESEKINLQYDYIDWNFVKWQRAIEFEKEKNIKRKIEIIDQLWHLKSQKDWLLILWENTKEIDEKIEKLKQEYFSI